VLLAECARKHYDCNRQHKECRHDAWDELNKLPKCRRLLEEKTVLPDDPGYHSSDEVDRQPARAQLAQSEGRWQAEYER
jgi:hypothetical protein